MINSPIHVYDNIGTSFTVKNSKIVLGKALPGYKTLTIDYINNYIPYLIKNINGGDIEWEVGVGQITLENNSIAIDRIKVVQSSNTDEMVSFSPKGNKVFYIFANESNFNVGFNNIVLRDDDFAVDNVNCIYVVDISEKRITATLPDSITNKGLEVKFKTVGDNSNDPTLYIRNFDGSIMSSISGLNRFVAMISTGEGWIELKDSDRTQSMQALSSDNSFSVMTTEASGNNKSLQYNDGGNLAGSEIYYSPSGIQLLGSSSSNNDFVVNGSGYKNLFFTYDGRLGLNMPSGVRPQTLLHLVNYSCQQGIRVENRNPLNPANITLYHKPSASISNNDTVASINLAGKNSIGLETNYSIIEGKAANTTTGQTKGKLNIIVDNAGSPTTGLSITPDQAVLGYSLNNVTVNNNGNIVLGSSGNNITVSSGAINLQSASIAIGNNNTVVTIPKFSSSNATISSSLALPSITPNTLLSVNSSGVVVGGSTISIPSIPSGRLLTTSVSGTIVGITDTNDYFHSTKDFTWNKYSLRYGNACLRQIVPTESIPAEEFAIGDQIAITTSTNTIYRKVTDLHITDGIIDGILIDTNVSNNTVSDISYYSITKGGYIENAMYTTSGTVSDSTSNIFSIRPQVDTVFNTSHKDINFVVYGTDTAPALEIFASAGRGSVSTGSYSAFSTTDPCNTMSTVYPISVTSGGAGVNNTNNTANFNNAASGSWSGMVTQVGTNGKASYYGTFDQNGNVSEWLSDSNVNSDSILQYAAGGGWDTSGTIGLRGLTELSYISGYNNVGFRVASTYGITDILSISSGLNLDFISVDDANNIPDTTPINFLVDSVSTPAIPADLGVVSYNYRIGTYEITNSQYSKFLNAVAVSDNYNLYNENMDSTDMGGISRSGSYGSYSYATKADMENMPVVYVSYINALRFANWLDNGAPTGVQNPSTVLDYGSYTITETQSQLLITKNPYHSYYLPSLNEWHKSAYYTPSIANVSGSISSVVIKRTTPYDISSSGNYASLSVSGYVYADDLIAGKALSTQSGSLRLLNNNSGIMTIGSGSLQSTISTTGINLKTSGEIHLDSQGLYTSGIFCENITTKIVTKIDDNGDVQAAIPGPDNGFLFKDPNSGEAYATSKFYMSMSTDGSGVAFSGGSGLTPLYLDEANFIKSYDKLKFSDKIESTVGLKVSEIQVGEDLPDFSGSILTHNGSGSAYWAPAEYLNAEGVSWTRYAKREVLVKDQELVFTGSSDLTQLAAEFPYTDTIAIVNSLTRQTAYIKAADGNFIVDGSGNYNPSTGVFYSTADGTAMKFCPSISWASSSGVSGTAFSVNRGGYLSMELEPSAISGFACHDADTADSPYRFKPSTLNTISIRPGIATVFNTLAEDIDFAVYGHKPTLYHRYEPSLFGKGDDGLPTGLVPALKVNSYTNNAVSGSLESGILYSGIINNTFTTPSGFHFDETAKTCINTGNPFVISSIPSGADTLALYADLTVNQYLYAKGIIADTIRINPVPSDSTIGKYVVNAPLTINASGQIVSQSPDTLPTAPGSPIALSGIPGYNALNLLWSPAKNGGKPIFNYIVEYASGIDPTANSWILLDRAQSMNTFIQVTGLNNTTPYSLRVSAVNSIGTGHPSQSYGYINPLAIYPESIANFSVVRQNSSAKLSWNNPGTSITEYEIGYSVDNGANWTSVAPFIDGQTTTLTGLENEPHYIFRIRGSNSYGYGAFTIQDSIGTDPPPKPDENNGSIWDFGIIAFTGVCS